MRNLNNRAPEYGAFAFAFPPKRTGGTPAAGGALCSMFNTIDIIHPKPLAEPQIIRHNSGTTASTEYQMPNKAQRIQITPSDRTRAILLRYKALTGKSMAGMISELLDESAPVLLEILDIHERLKNKPTMEKKAILEFAQSGKHKISEIESQIELAFKPKRGRKPKDRAPA